MRGARQKVKNKDCYYHCYSRIAGPKDLYLFTDVDKEKGMSIVVDLCKLFLIEPISMTWMDNHWHIIVFAPSKVPSIEEAAERYNLYYKKKNKQVICPIDNPKRCKDIAERMIDISCFMQQIHQKFTFHINRTHNRRGTLWAERFKSTILQKENALWNCVKYVELNPVRAGIIDDPMDYRFSTWGNYNGIGKHLFGDNFSRHMRRCFGLKAANWSDEDIFAKFRSQLARIIADESGALMNEIKEAGELARKKESIPIRFLRRTRHWTDGAIIGSKAFVQSVACRFDDSKKVMKKQLSCGTDLSDNIIYCYKRLQRNLN